MLRNNFYPNLFKTRNVKNLGTTTGKCFEYFFYQNVIKLSSKIKLKLFFLRRYCRNNDWIRKNGPNYRFKQNNLHVFLDFWRPVFRLDDIFDFQMDKRHNSEPISKVWHWKSVQFKIKIRILFLTWFYFRSDSKLSSLRSFRILYFTGGSLFLIIIPTYIFSLIEGN